MRPKTFFILVSLVILSFLCLFNPSFADKYDFPTPCAPTLSIVGTMHYVDLEGGCLVFEADDGHKFQPLDGPQWMYEDGLRGTLFAEPYPEIATKCMIGMAVRVCKFIPEDGACISNEDCPSLDAFCKKPTGDCDGPGICMEKPEECPLYYDPVCGCDGKTYSNECDAAMNGVSIAHRGACETTTCPGDFNGDGKVDRRDLRIFARTFGIVIPVDSTLPTDLDNDGDVDGKDLAAFARLYGKPCEPHIIEYSNRGCLTGTQIDPTYGEYPFCGEDELEAKADGSLIHIIHKNATYNCCAEDIRVDMDVMGNTLRLTETEVGPLCFCLCCYNIETTIAVPDPNSYEIEYCWFDYENSQSICYLIYP